MIENEVTSEITPPTVPSVNATQQDQIQLKMLQILERIDKKLDNKSSPTKRKRKVLDCYY